MEPHSGLNQNQNEAKINTEKDWTVYTNEMDVAIIRFLLDDDLTIVWANDVFYPSVSSMRQLCSQHPDAFTQLKDQLIQAVNKREPKVICTITLPNKDGELSWYRLSGTIGQTNGQTVCCAALCDVSDLVAQKDQKLHYFQWMLEEYGGNIYVSDMENNELLYLNKAALTTLYETTHLTPDQILGRKCYEVIQGRSAPCPFCTNDRITENEFYEWEYFNPTLKRTFMIKNRVIDWAGRRARIELSHDMYSTEYKLAKKDREREAIMRTIPGGFARIDARDCTTVLWYGAGFLQIIGYTKAQFEQKLRSRCTYIHPEDLDRRISIMDKVRKTGKSDVYECRIRTYSGETKIMTMTLCYVSAEDSWDGIPSFYSVGIDITEERAEQERQHKALEDAYQAARVASAAKSNFLSSMSHDIRTPMNAIMGMAAIAQANLYNPEKVQDCLNKINASSLHLLSLINEVLDMSKIESGKIDLALETVDLSILTQTVVDMCRPLIAEKRQQLKMSVGLVSHEKVVADGDRLRQVMTNLLSNAIKYTPEGGTISLRINELASPLPQKRQFEFIFTDTGIGMSEEFLSHIFEPFARAEDSRISKIQGTGLGMAITENIVRMMNGTIQVKSQMNKGSQFTVSIPLEIEEEEESCNLQLAGMPVLVVDDDQMVCENATTLLNELGMRAYWVLSGAEAVTQVMKAHQQKDDFFAVILDWKMPNMDGLSTLKAIRKKLGDSVPIIIISAYDYSSIEDTFIQAGADAFITKPLFKSRMLHVLQMFCDQHYTEASRPPEQDVHPNLTGKRILVAEDNELNREIVVELLGMQGLLVDAVENGQLAVNAFNASSKGYYSAILMDIQMPVMNGYDATSAIRALSRKDAKTVPILALTANAFATDVGKARNVGMNDHIAKPIDVANLFQALKKWI